MNAKRLTALALAALMAASTTSVALASEKVEYDLDFTNDGYYRYDEDEGRIVKAAPDYTFAPGEKIYVRLEEDDSNPDDKFPNKKSYDAYAEWKLGDSWVKDIDLVYKKGSITTPGATTTEYYIKGLSDTLASLNGTKLDANTLDSLKKVVEASGAYKTMVENKLNTKYKKSAYQVIGTEDKYATEKEAAEKSIEKAINDRTVTEESSYKTVDGKQYKNNSLPSNIVNASNNGYVSASKFYADRNLATALSENGWHLYDAEYEKHQKLYYGAGDDAKNSGAVNDTSGTAVSNSDNIYVDKAPNAGAAKFIKLAIDKSEVAAATGGAVKAATNEYYDNQANNKLVTVQDVNTTGYFKGDEFLGRTKEEAGKKNKGYQEVQNVWYDDNGPSTEEKARAAAKASVDQTLQLSVANNIESKQVTGPSSTTAQYEYWVEISTKSSNSTKENDLVGTLYTGTSKSNAKDGDSFRLEVTLSNQSNNSGDKNDYKDATDYVTIEDGERAIVSFADDASDEFEVEFGDDARFVFNARGQSKLNLAYNTKYDKDFAYDYDDANIDFLTFEGEPTTNRTGTLYIYADEDSYIYEVTPRGAKKINGAKYNHDEEAWEIRTRNLTSYAISDKKLKTVDQMDNGSSSDSSNKPGNNKPGSNKPGNNNDKPNPDTGR